MEEILDFLKFIYPKLSEECLDFLRTVVKMQVLKRKEIILRPGDVCRKLYFIKKGLLRCFYLVDDKELTDWVFSENDTVVSVRSFYDQVPSTDFIQALEPSELYYISFEHLDYAYRHYLEFNFVGRVLTVKYLRVWHELARNIRLLDATERFELLMEQQPGLLLRVPQHVLATWLDMHPVTLSRLRSEYKKKLASANRGRQKPS
jgi:CRP-like cAMP-binding protein